MAGIIQSAQNHEPGENEATEAETPADETAEGEAPEGRKITPQAARASMAVPPEKQAAYAKVVAAGKKILYSPEMDSEIAELLSGEGDMGEKLGMGAFALVTLLLSKSNGTVPPDLLIPAGCELVADAGAMLEEQGQKVTDKDIARGATVYVQRVMKQTGIDESQLASMGGAQPQEVEQPEAEEPEEA